MTLLDLSQAQMKFRYVKSTISVNRGHKAAVALSIGLLFCLDLKQVGAPMPLAPGPKGDISSVAGTIAAQSRVEVSSESLGSSPVVNKVARPSEDSEREVFEL